MTTPDVPLRLELSVEVQATPEQVWEAIATADGISSWFLRTDLEEREGGAIVTHMGEDASSPGTVTGWEPPTRFVYEEPDWASLSGHEGAPVTPLVTEFVVEARSGGTCVVRVTSSAFGTGADWENEFFDGMTRGWLPFFDRLKLYVARYPGRRATTLEAQATVPGTAEGVMEAVRERLRVTSAGQEVDAQGLTGRVERLTAWDLLVHLDRPVSGFLGFGAFDGEEGKTMTFVHGHLFSEDASGFVERAQREWQEWLESLDVRAVADRPT